jgi:protein-S-isoprenylcysteine O-methyltransferase Ste14
MLVTLYFLLYLVTVTILRVFLVWIYRGAWVFMTPGSVGSLKIGLVLRILFMFSQSLSADFFPEFYGKYFFPFRNVEALQLRNVGEILYIAGILWIVFAQSHMHKNWRMSINVNEKTELITHGLFSYTRNPIYLGAILCNISSFLILPNLLSLAVMISLPLLFKLQVSSEEEYLLRIHGQTYREYCAKTPRWIGILSDPKSVGDESTPLEKRENIL